MKTQKTLTYHAGQFATILALAMQFALAKAAMGAFAMVRVILSPAKSIKSRAPQMAAKVVLNVVAVPVLVVGLALMAPAVFLTMCSKK
jgi:hypothetical protein